MMQQAAEQRALGQQPGAVPDRVFERDEDAGRVQELHRLCGHAGGKERAKITIADTGPGIPQEALPRVAERFYRASDRGEGFGLGLGLLLGDAEALGSEVAHRARATERPAPTLTLVPEDDRVRRAAAQDKVDEAARLVEQARADLEQAEGEVGTLRARRLQLQGEIDELRRRLAALEDDVDRVDEDLEDAEAARGEAAEEVAAAEDELAAAQKALDAG